MSRSPWFAVLTSALVGALAVSAGACTKEASSKSGAQEGAPAAEAQGTTAPGAAPAAGPGEAATGAPAADPAPAVTGAGTPAITPKKVAVAKPAAGGDEAAPEPAAGGDPSYAVKLEPPAEVSAGGEAVARIKVTPGPGYKMNKEFPTKLTLQPPAGVTLAKTELVLADAEAFDDTQLVFAVKATPASAGAYEIPAKIKFAVCTDATCDPKRENLTIRVAAK